MNAHIYEQITERIIALLAQGTVPWQKPWRARTGLPRKAWKMETTFGLPRMCSIISEFRQSGFLPLSQLRMT